MKVITIGRGQDNDIVINDPQISRNHLQLIQKDDGTVSVVDLNSSNGTYVNGHRLNGEYILSKNDTILIGRTTLQWQKYVTISRNHSVKKKIIISLSILIAAGAIATGIVLLCKDKKDEEITALDKFQPGERTELKLAAEEQYKNNLREQRNANKQLAKEKEEEAKKAKQRAVKAEDAKKEAIKKAETAEQAKNEAEKKAKAAEEAQRKAEENAETAKLNKDIAEEKAAAEQNARREAEKKAEEARNLTEKTLDDFYSMVFQELKTKNNKLKSVAIQLGASDTTSNHEQYINSMYEKGSISEKREIIDKIQAEIESRGTRVDDSDSTKTSSNDK